MHNSLQNYMFTPFQQWFFFTLILPDTGVAFHIINYKWEVGG